MKNLKDMSIDRRLKKLIYNESNAPDKAKMDQIQQLVLSQTESSSTFADFFSFKVLAVGGLATVLLAIILFSQITITPNNNVKVPSDRLITLSDTGHAILALTENDESMQNMLVMLSDFTNSDQEYQEYDEEAIHPTAVLNPSDFSSPYENLF